MLGEHQDFVDEVGLVLHLGLGLGLGLVEIFFVFGEGTYPKR